MILLMKGTSPAPQQFKLRLEMLVIQVSSAASIVLRQDTFFFQLSELNNNDNLKPTHLYHFHYCFL